MAKPINTLPRHIQVQSSIQISPNMQRIYFSSDDFSNFPLDAGGGHIKLFFPEQQNLAPPLPTKNELGKVIWPNGKKPLTRTYTVRDFIKEQQLLVVDFVRHEAFGIAANWATQAQVGDILGLAGPGGPARFNPEADYFVFIGDLSALPMIAASLEQLAQDAQGEVWIEIEQIDDQQKLTLPQAVKIHWLLQTTQNIEEQIEASFAQLDWKNKNISVSLAGENNRVVNLRNILRKKYQINRNNLYAVPYWKQGHTEENYHDERHSIMDNDV